MTIDARRRLATDILTLAGFCGFFLFFGLGSFGLVGADEPRYAQVAREMYARGDAVTPTLHGAPWLEKPVLYYWRAMFAYWMFGVSDWTARMPSTTFATAMVVIVYLFMRRFRRGSELDAALITLTCAAIVGFGRGASVDMQLAAPFAVAMMAWFAWYSETRRLWLIAFYVMLAFAVLAKGPVAVVLAGLAIGAFCLLRGEMRRIVETLWLPGLLIFFALSLPWYLAVQRANPEFLRVFLLEHNLARLATDMFRHQQPFWYYVPVVLLSLMPWTLFAVVALVVAVRDWKTERRREGDGLTLFLALWGLAPLLFFSLSQSKLPGYILPGVPAFTLLAADYAQRRMREGWRPPWRVLLLHAMIAAALLTAVALYPYLAAKPRITPPATMLAVIAAITGILVAGIAVTLRVRGLRMLRLVTLAPAILTVGYIVRALAPSIDATQSARPVAAEIARIEAQKLEVAVFGASRHTEYGLGFYRDAKIPRYGRDPLPEGDHLVVAPAGSRGELEKLVAPRRVSQVGAFAPQRLEYFWVSEPRHH